MIFTSSRSSPLIRWHFKASLSCYIPSYAYTIDSTGASVDVEIEVLRALPAHLLNGGIGLGRQRSSLNFFNRCFRTSGSGELESESEKPGREKGEGYAPRVPSPLRQCESVSVSLRRRRKTERWVAEDETDRERSKILVLELDGPCIPMLCVFKRGGRETPSTRRPLSWLFNPVHNHRNCLRRTAYTFVFSSARSRQRGLHKTINSCSAPPTRPTIPSKSRHSLASLREELAGTQQQLLLLRDRISRLESVERRSVYAQIRAEEQQARLDEVCRALLGGERARLEELRKRGMGWRERPPSPSRMNCVHAQHSLCLEGGRRVRQSRGSDETENKRAMRRITNALSLIISLLSASINIHTSMASKPDPTPSPSKPVGGRDGGGGRGLTTRYRATLAALSARTGTALPALVTSFAVLHEATAVVPLVGVFYACRTFGVGEQVVGYVRRASSDTTSNDREARKWMMGLGERWMEEGEAWTERVGRRYAIWGFERTGAHPPSSQSSTPTLSLSSPTSSLSTGVAGDVANALVAYCATKALLPVRIGVSLYFAPAFARVVVCPISRSVGRLFRRSK